MSKRFCPYCGNPYPVGEAFCSNCGAHLETDEIKPIEPPKTTYENQYHSTPDYYPSPHMVQQQPVYTPQPYVRESNDAANMAIIFALVGCFCIPVIPSIVAFILGIGALGKETGKDKAILAIILSVIPLFAIIIPIIIVFV